METYWLKRLGVGDGWPVADRKQSAYLYRDDERFARGILTGLVKQHRVFFSRGRQILL